MDCKLCAFLELLLLLVIWNGPIAKVSANPCLSLTGISMNLSDHVTFSLPNRSDLSSHVINVTYKWDVTVEKGVDYDGFLYKFVDTDANTNNNLNKRSLSEVPLGDFPSSLVPLPSSPRVDFALLRCQKHIGSNIYVTAANGSSVKCAFPCKHMLGQPCSVGTGLCNRLGTNFQVLDKDQRNITLPISFGRTYSFEVLPYQGFRASKVSYRGGDDKVYLYCAHHLIEEQGVDRGRAYDFCRSTQDMSEREASSSPVDLSVEDLTPDLATNRANVVVRWRSPHDVLAGRRVLRYMVRLLPRTPGVVLPLSFKGKTEAEEKLNPFYNWTLNGLEPNTAYEILLTPYVDRTGDSCQVWDTCNYHGAGGTVSFVSADVNACELGYCSQDADCLDLAVFANCTCKPGYTGGGVSLRLNGTGCQDLDACLDLDSCSDAATCVDEPPPSLGVSCQCGPNYFGDGLRNGTGCTERRLVVGIAVGVPMVALFVCAAFLFVWRYRTTKKRARNLKFSKFVPLRSGTYSTPQVIQNDHAQREMAQNGPVFGTKWELQRNDIEKQDVIGRGNFGVVHRATLRKDGTEKTVAVKALTGAYASCYRDDFLAEMSLLISLGCHDNVLGVVGVCTSQMNSAEEQLSPFLVTEFMTYGDLLHFLWDARETAKRQSDPTYDFNENSLYNIGHQVASGLQFLSSSKIIHGDVAARNILVGENLQCKISDFGLANDVYRYGMIKGATERRVPFKWVSPERMMGGKVPITWRSDVWSFGILLYEMVTLGAAPYPSMEPRSIFGALQEGYRMERPSSCNEYLYDIMTQCWNWNALQRPTFKQLKDKLAKPLSQHVDPAHLTEQRAIQSTEGLDIQSYEADIGRRDNDCSSPPNGLLENGFPVGNGTNGRHVVGNGIVATDESSRAGDEPATLHILNGCTTHNWSGNIPVRIDSQDQVIDNLQSDAV